MSDNNSYQLNFQKFALMMVGALKEDTVALSHHSGLLKFFYSS